MGADPHRGDRTAESESVAKETVPETDMTRRDDTAQGDLPIVRILCGSASGLRLDFSKQGTEYSRRIARKLVRARVSSKTWKNYTCRAGAVVQFVAPDGTTVGEARPLHRMRVKILVKQKTVRGIFIKDLQGPDGETIELPAMAKGPGTNRDVDPGENTPAQPKASEPLSSETDSVSPLASKPLANWNRLKTKKPVAENARRPAAAKQLPDAAASAAGSLPSQQRAAGEPPSWAFDRTKPGASTFAASTWGVPVAAREEQQWEWLTPSRSAEQQLRNLMEERNGDLHIKRQQTNERRRQKRETIVEGPTWIDSFFKIAKQKFGKLETPLCRLAEVYLRPDYLSAPHADKKSATMAVDRVVGLLIGARKTGKSALQKFAAEVLERGQYKDLENVQVAGATRKDLSQLVNKLSDPKTSMSDGLQIILNDLGDSIRFEYEQMRKTGNESEKIESIGKCRGALAQAEKSKAFRNCTAEQRDQLKGVIHGWGDRITSYVNVNQLPQKGS